MDELLKKYRKANEEALESKQMLGQERQRLDSLVLTLNNLKYQKQHLDLEIQKCKSYEPIYQDIDEFDVKPNDSILLQLQTELKVRTAMSLKISEMKQQKIVKLKAIQDKQRELQELEADILKFSDATSEIQKIFGCDMAMLDQNYCQSQLLPRPLFILYRHCLGYQKWRENALLVNITHEPVQSLGNYQSHNLSISVILLSNSTSFIKFWFVYLTQLEMVIVKPELIEPFDNVPAAFFSDNLFPGDDGRHPCNPKLLFLDNGNFKFDHQQCKGYPYSWAQYFCGFDYPGLNDWNTNDSRTWILNDNGEPCVPFFSRFIDLVTDKRAQAVQINTALASMTLKPHFAELKSQKTPKCRISMFKRTQA